MYIVYDEPRQDNDVIDCTGVAYAKNETELLWLIRPGMICDENQTTTWPIIHVHSMSKIILIIVTDRIGCRLWWKPEMTMTWPII